VTARLPRLPIPRIALLAPSIVDMLLEDWHRQIAVNLDVVFLSAKHCIPAMRRAGGGSIIMMSSIAGIRGSASLPGYRATKGAVRLLAKAIAMECASAGDGIRVNTVPFSEVSPPCLTASVTLRDARYLKTIGKLP
jgi:NAD(P)-dependent dehydrogenase (short-subunit alcohol dehydrogenase family)